MNAPELAGVDEPSLQESHPQLHEWLLAVFTRPRSRVAQRLAVYIAEELVRQMSGGAERPTELKVQFEPASVALGTTRFRVETALRSLQRARLLDVVRRTGMFETEAALVRLGKAHARRPRGAR